MASIWLLMSITGSSLVLVVLSVDAPVPDARRRSRRPRASSVASASSGWLQNPRKWSSHSSTPRIGDGIDGVEPAGALGADRGEPVVPQHPQVLRHSRLRDAELPLDDLGDRTGGPLPIGEQLQDPAPDRITEDIEGVHESDYDQPRLI